MWWGFRVAKRPLNFERHQEIHSESHCASNYTRWGTITGTRTVELSQHWPLSCDQANGMSPCPPADCAQRHDAASYRSVRLWSRAFHVKPHGHTILQLLVGETTEWLVCFKNSKDSLGLIRTTGLCCKDERLGWILNPERRISFHLLWCRSARAKPLLCHWYHTQSLPSTSSY